MIFSKAGNVHIKHMCNNQDFYLLKDNFFLLTDGSSVGGDSDFGTRLFCKLFNMENVKEDGSDFEEKVEKVFKKIFKIFNINVEENLKTDDLIFLMLNFAFSIFACFETKESFIVKFLESGYIITQNINDEISYIKINYKSDLHYFIYNYYPAQKEKIKFEEYVFSKKDFKRVGLASEGIESIVFSKMNATDKIKFDSLLLNESDFNKERNVNQVLKLIEDNPNFFNEDVTILF